MRRLFSVLASGLLLHSGVWAQEPEARQPKIRPALLPGSPAADAATQIALLQWLTRFQDTLHRMRMRDCLEVVDWEALADTACAGESPRPDEAQKLRFQKSLMTATERMLPLMRPFLLFEDAEVRRIDRQGDRAVMTARVHDKEGLEYRLRWWLVRHDGQWRMADFENISAHMRFSTLLLTGIHAASPQEGPGSEPTAGFARMSMAMQDGEIDEAYAILKTLEASKIPAVLGESFLVAKVGVLSQYGDKQDEFEAALRDLEKTAPESPVLFLIRATSAYAASDYHGTITWARRIGASVGHDESTWSMLADAHHQLGQEKDYLTTAESWAADYPGSAQALWNLWLALPPEQREGRVRPLLEGIRPAESGLREFADSAYLADDLPALKLACGVMQTRRLSPATLHEYDKTLQEAEEARKNSPQGTPRRE